MSFPLHVATPMLKAASCDSTTTLPVVPQAAAIQWHGDAHESESDAE